MAKVSIKKISKKMRKLDICSMSTISEKGAIASRPMSNNGDVEYDGNSYFFTWEKSQLIKDLKKNSQVNLEFRGPKKLFISVEGKAKLTHDRDEMSKHWTKDLETWFEKGPDTPGVVMIQVAAKRIKLWQGEQEDEVVIR